MHHAAEILLDEVGVLGPQLHRDLLARFLRRAHALAQRTACQGAEVSTVTSTNLRPRLRLRHRISGSCPDEGHRKRAASASRRGARKHDRQGGSVQRLRHALVGEDKRGTTSPGKPNAGQTNSPDHVAELPEPVAVSVPEPYGQTPATLAAFPLTATTMCPV